MKKEATESDEMKKIISVVNISSSPSSRFCKDINKLRRGGRVNTEIE